MLLNNYPLYLFYNLFQIEQANILLASTYAHTLTLHYSFLPWHPQNRRDKCEEKTVVESSPDSGAVLKFTSSHQCIRYALNIIHCISRAMKSKLDPSPLCKLT